MTHQEAPARVLIYGSCVSRDTFEYLPTDRYSLVRYVARQSLISAFAAKPASIDVTAIESSFQRRMLLGDAEGNLPTVIGEYARATDLLVWDLADERLGVFVSGDGKVITRSVEAVNAGLESAVAGWEHLPFGSARHLERWRTALDAFVSVLDQHRLLHRTLLLKVAWADYAEDGTPTPSSFGMSSRQAQALFEHYYNAAAERGVKILDVPHTLAASDHRWGLAPFHYSDATYLDIVRCLEAALTESPTAPHSERTRPE